MGFWKKLVGIRHGAEEIADAVVYVVVKDAFIHLRDAKFQKFLTWQGASDDRKAEIKIELELGGIVLAYLLLEALEDHVEHPRSKESVRSVRNELVSAFLRHVKHGEPDQQMREMIAQLIARRCEECRDDFQRRKNKLRPQDLKRIYWIEFCATNALNHLLAEEPLAEERDLKLYKNLATWNMRLATNIQKSILRRAKLTRLSDSSD